MLFEGQKLLGIYLVLLFGGVFLLAAYLSWDKRVEHTTDPTYESENGRRFEEMYSSEEYIDAKRKTEQYYGPSY